VAPKGVYTGSVNFFSSLLKLLFFKVGSKKLVIFVAFISHPKKWWLISYDHDPHPKNPDPTWSGSAALAA
jgi:hypothetical protein